MSKGSFKKIQNSERRIYGPRKLLLTGFAASVQERFKSLLQTLGVVDVALVWATEYQSETTIDDLAQFGFGG